jgi:HEAT repeat protein
MERIPSSNRLLAACRDQDSGRQFEAMPLLAQYYPDIAPKVFVELLTSPEHTVRWKAASLLGELGRKYVTITGPALFQALEDPEQLVRCEALKTLKKLGYPLAKERLLSLLHRDSAWQVRSTAVEAVGSLNDVSLLPELEEVFQKETSPAIRATAIRSMGLLASPEYLPKLEHYLSTDSTPAVQREGFVAAYRLGDRTKLEPLLLLFEKTDAKGFWSIFFTLQYLVACHPPASLHLDSTAIRKAVVDITTRLPAFSVATHKLLADLAKLEAQ